MLNRIGPAIFPWLAALLMATGVEGARPSPRNMPSRPAPKAPAAQAAGREAAPEPERPPAPEPVAIEFEVGGEGYEASISAIPESAPSVACWGVTKDAARILTKTGARAGRRVPAGVLAEAIRVFQVDGGRQLAEVRLWLSERWTAPVCIETSDMLLFEGGRGAIGRREVDALCGYYRLKREMERRRLELDQAASSGNPYAARLREMATAYGEKAQKAEELIARRDAAKGAERTRIANELRRMEVETTRDEMDLKRQTALYNEWKAKHGEKADYEADAEYRRIKAAFDECAAAVAPMGVMLGD